MDDSEGEGGELMLLVSWLCMYWMGREEWTGSVYVLCVYGEENEDEWCTHKQYYAIALRLIPESVNHAITIFVQQLVANSPILPFGLIRPCWLIAHAVLALARAQCIDKDTYPDI